MVLTMTREMGVVPLLSWDTSYARSVDVQQQAESAGDISVSSQTVSVWDE